MAAIGISLRSRLPDTKIANWEDIVPIGDPAYLFEAEDEVVDERVHDPSEDAFEAAVRGAVEQFKSSPYLRRSNGEYDVTLRQGVRSEATIYAPSGNTVAPANDGQSPAYLKCQHVFQTRSVILNRLTNDFQGYINGLRANNDNPDAPFDHQSLAARLGLVFRADLGGNVNERAAKAAELVVQLNKAKLSQRTSPAA